jgi:subtilisin-like proprotein convertase family protein
VVGQLDGKLHTYENVSGVFTELTGPANPFDGLNPGSFSSPSFVDIDGDGDMDAVMGNVNGTLRTFMNSAGVFTEATGAANPFNGLGVASYSSPSFADVDGDGDIDAVVGTFNGTLTTFLNNLGVFTQATGAANPFNGLDVGSSSAPSFVDLDGDGDTDAVVGADAGTLRSFQNNGAGLFTELTGAANPFDGVDVSSYSSPSFADIDGDGDIDAMVGDWFGTLSGFLNDGAGAFTEQVRRGYDATAYTDHFNGTSASAPVVSGVVALMLQAGPGLGWRDVQDILAASARLTGSAFGAGPSSVEDGVWQTNGATTWNGGGYHLHTNYGYGMVDAYNAVRMAEVWHLFGAAETSANEVLVQSGLNDFVDTMVPEGAGSFSTTFTIAGNVEIDHVALQLDLASEGIRDLQVEMTSASGTVIQAAVLDLIDPGPATDVQWVYGIEGFRGELAAGTWTLTITDPFVGATTTVRSASLDVYGSAESVNDAYHFTDEYLTMRGFEAGRGTVSDTNGGVDWLNFSAVTGNVALALGLGQVVTVAGVVWATLSDLFENVVAGDGSDTLVGSDDANQLHGMRGADSLDGSDGADTLHGGAGGDRLNGGLGNDTLVGGAGTELPPENRTVTEATI